MPQPIGRMYSSHETASAAAQDLRDHGFSSDAVHVVARPEQQETTSTDTGTSSGPVSDNDPVLQSVTKTGVPPAHGKIYAERIHRGEVLVVVNPPFGYARLAGEILQSHDPIEVDVPEVEAGGGGTTAARAGIGWRDATPLSSALGWPVLLSDPTPLSNWLKRPTLKPEPAASKTLEKIRQQSHDATPLSSKLGMAVLSDNPAPLSSKLGWRLLSEKAAPLSERAGWRVLSEKAAPLSERFGWRVLLDNPTPLSSRFGWKVLSDNPAPLSSSVGSPTVSKD